MAAGKRQGGKQDPKSRPKGMPPQMRCGKRQTKCTPKLTQELCQLIRCGTFMETACAAVGIPSRTMRIWLKKGAEAGDDENEFTRFRDAVLAAEAECESNGAKQISEAGKDDWRAIAWLMERRFSRRWAQRVRVQVESELDRMLDRAERVLSPEDFELLLEAVAAEDGAEEAGEAEE